MEKLYNLLNAELEEIYTMLQKEHGIGIPEDQTAEFAQFVRLLRNVNENLQDTDDVIVVQIQKWLEDKGRGSTTVVPWSGVYKDMSGERTPKFITASKTMHADLAGVPFIDFSVNCLKNTPEMFRGRTPQDHETALMWLEIIFEDAIKAALDELADGNQFKSIGPEINFFAQECVNALKQGTFVTSGISNYIHRVGTYHAVSTTEFDLISQAKPLVAERILLLSDNTIDRSSNLVASNYMNTYGELERRGATGLNSDRTDTNIVCPMTPFMFNQYVTPLLATSILGLYIYWLTLLSEDLLEKHLQIPAWYKFIPHDQTET